MIAFYFVRIFIDVSSFSFHIIRIVFVCSVVLDYFTSDNDGVNEKATNWFDVPFFTTSKNSDRSFPADRLKSDFHNLSNNFMC